MFPCFLSNTPKSPILIHVLLRSSQLRPAGLLRHNDLVDLQNGNGRVHRQPQRVPLGRVHVPDGPLPLGHIAHPVPLVRTPRRALPPDPRRPRSADPPCTSPSARSPPSPRSSPRSPPASAAPLPAPPRTTPHPASTFPPSAPRTGRAPGTPRRTRPPAPPCPPRPRRRRGLTAGPCRASSRR